MRSQARQARLAASSSAVVSHGEHSADPEAVPPRPGGWLQRSGLRSSRDVRLRLATESRTQRRANPEPESPRTCVHDSDGHPQRRGDGPAPRLALVEGRCALVDRQGDEDHHPHGDDGREPPPQPGDYVPDDHADHERWVAGEEFHRPRLSPLCPAGDHDAPVVCADAVCHFRRGIRTYHLPGVGTGESGTRQRLRKLAECVGGSALWLPTAAAAAKRDLASPARVSGFASTTSHRRCAPLPSRHADVASPDRSALRLSDGNDRPRPRARRPPFACSRR